MPGEKWETILAEIAKSNHTTPENIQGEIWLAMEQGRNDPDPEVQDRWAQIPQKGGNLTLGEFLDYLLKWVTA